MESRAKLTCKAIGSILALWLSWESAVGGRSMGPGLGFLSNVNPILYFSLVMIPLLFCPAVWGARRGFAILAIAVPSLIVAAHLLCTMEEDHFIETHRMSGAGPTPRYFDPNSWLAYDASTGELTGSD